MPLNAISKQLEMLNYEWFSNKKNWFRKETFYDNTQDKISETLKNTVYFYENDTFEDIETVIDMDLQDYCWNSHYPSSLSGVDELNIQLPADSNSVSEEIINSLNELVSQTPDNEAKYNIIKSIIRIATDKIDEFKQKESDEAYRRVLDDFLIRLKNNINSKFRAIKQIRLLSKEYPERERLDFNLNQEELGVLLLILNTAGILRTSSPTDTNFLNFCSERFYFDNQKAKTFTKATGIRNKYNDAKQHASKAREKVIQLLKKTLKEV